ncbi:MAG: peptidoglycan-binding domain-containing protein [Actinomycetota bacterium]|nr:peptidoglycan-binding domain-containing protein [Actinomycetota bacterium]
MRRGYTTIVVAVVALVAAACGGEGAADTTSSTTSSIGFTSTTLATTTTTLATTTTTTEPGPVLRATDTTLRVQIDLKALGFFDGQVDGIAGEETQAALKAFQTQQGISADGEFGPQTDGIMYPLLMEDTAYVEELQKNLEDLGIYTGPVDGDYGKGTTAAVKKLQGSCDLEETGSIDIATRICLDHAT